MSRTTLRTLSVLLVLLSLSLPLGAQPAARETARASSALAVLWNRLTTSLLSIVSGETTDSRGACDPNGGACVSAATTDGRSICDPNGGACVSAIVTTDGRSICDPDGGACVSAIVTTDGRSACDPDGRNCY